MKLIHCKIFAYEWMEYNNLDCIDVCIAILNCSSFICMISILGSVVICQLNNRNWDAMKMLNGNAIINFYRMLVGLERDNYDGI